MSLPGSSSVGTPAVPVRDAASAAASGGSLAVAPEDPAARWVARRSLAEAPGGRRSLPATARDEPPLATPATCVPAPESAPPPPEPPPPEGPLISAEPRIA